MENIRQATVIKKSLEFRKGEEPEIKHYTLELLKQCFSLEGLDKRDLDFVEENTGQRLNPLWMKERSVRLTASCFGQVCKMRPTTSTDNLVKNILYAKPSNTAPILHGIINQEKAAAFEKKCCPEVEPCGLFIDQNKRFFAFFTRWKYW